MLNMVESRVIEHAWRQWEPQIIYVHHQIGAVPDAHLAAAVRRADRQRRAVPDVARGEHDRHGDRARASRSAARSARRTWAPASTRGIPATSTTCRCFKNIAAFWTETALYRYATPHEYTIDDFPQNMRDLRPQQPLLEPVAAGLVAAAGRRRLHGDGVDVGARLRGEVQGGAAATTATRPAAIRSRSARQKPPYAYVIPQQQRDPVAAVELLRRLAFSGVRVSQLTGAGRRSTATTFPPGTWVIPMDQEFAALARQVLDVQRYPGPARVSRRSARAPYDAAGWTLPLQMGVRVVAGDDARWPTRRGAR